MVQWFDYYVLLFSPSAVFCNSDHFLGVFTEVSRKWTPKQTVDGSQEEIHGHGTTPSGI